jgi:hypothetical protein
MSQNNEVSLGGKIFALQYKRSIYSFESSLKSSTPILIKSYENNDFIHSQRLSAAIGKNSHIPSAAESIN